MHKKVPCNTGMVVDFAGNIMRAWCWAGDPKIENPLSFEQDKGLCVELTKEEYNSFNRELHTHKYDHESNSVVHRDSGKTRCKIKTPQEAGLLKEQK